MTRQLAVFICLAISCVVVASHDIFTMTAVDRLPLRADPTTFFALTEDILVVNVQSDAYNFQLRRRDADGNYVLANNLTIPGTYPITNGRFLGVYSTGSGSLIIGELVNDELVNPTTLPPNYIVQGAEIYDDDTLVIYDRSSTSLITFEFNATTSVWDVIQQTSLDGALPLNFNGYMPQSAFQGKFFIARYETNSTLCDLLIFERGANLAWNLLATFSLTGLPTGYRNGHAVFNGIDTVALADLTAGPDDYYIGEISLFMKTDEVWTLQQTINPMVLGYRPLIYFGMSMSFITSQTLVVSSPLENVMFSPDERVGRIAVFSLNSTRQWTITFELVSTVDAYIFGKGFGFNSKDLVAFGFTQGSQSIDLNSPPEEKGRLYTLPRCYLAPLDVTCSTLDLADCSEIPTDLYSFDPRCQSVISPKWLGLSNTVDNRLSVHYSFTKFGSTTKCSSSVSCPSQTCEPYASPTVISSPAAPSPSQSPTASPVEFAPVTAPVTPPVTAEPVQVPESVPEVVPIADVPTDAPVAVPVNVAPIANVDIPVAPSVPQSPPVASTPASVPSSRVPTSHVPVSSPPHGPHRPPVATIPHGRPPRPRPHSTTPRDDP